MCAVTLPFQSKAIHGSPSSGPRQPAKNTPPVTGPPSRSVFTAAMEDVPSDDEIAATTPSNHLPVTKQSASGHKNKASPLPHASSKASPSPASSKPQPHVLHGGDQTKALQPSTKEISQAVHASRNSKTAAVMAVDEDSGDESATLNIDAALSAPTSAVCSALQRERLPVDCSDIKC
jgi:hypothetical protein